MDQEKKWNKVNRVNTRQENGEMNKNIGDFLIEKSKQIGDKPFLLVYKHHEVLLGQVKDKSIHLEQEDQLTVEYLKELRMFSKTGELYIWNQKGKFNYRLRIDEDEAGNDHIYEEAHYMWGNEPDDNDKNTALEPNRGMRLKFPFSLQNKKLPLKYVVRNYLDFDHNGQIQFYDARLVKFLDADGEELKNV